jgi:hypothetical protein
MNQINQYPIEATILEDGDFMDIDKDLGGGTYESQKIQGQNIIYDSGYVQIPAWNGSFGMADIGAIYRPYIRVQNRIVQLVGRYIIPMDNGAAGLDPNGNGYPSQYRQLAHYTGADGFTQGTVGQIFTTNPIVPSALIPERNALQERGFVLNRTYFPSGAMGRMRLVTLCPQAAVLSNGSLFFASIETEERDGLTTANYGKTHLAREWASKFQSGDSIMDYTAWYNSFDAPGTGDKRVYTDTGDNYDFPHDSTTAFNFGGYRMDFNMWWAIDKATTITQIKAAIDSM